jgi:hypothetical protein
MGGHRPMMASKPTNPPGQPLSPDLPFGVYGGLVGRKLCCHAACRAVVRAGPAGSS